MQVCNHIINYEIGIAKQPKKISKRSISLNAKKKNNKELSSIEDRIANTNVCCDGKKIFVTWQIVILKIKITPVSINAVANCNEHFLSSDDVMPIRCLLNAHDGITLLICRQMISC